MKKGMLHEKIECRDVRALVEFAGEKYAELCAYSYRINPRDKEVQKATFSQLRDDVRALASKLLKLGCAGRHCILIGKFSYDWVRTYFAVLSIGGVIVPLDRDWLCEDLAETAKKADIAFLFCDEELSEKAEYIESETDTAPCIYLCAKEKENSLENLIESGRTLYNNDPDAYHNAEIDPFKMSLLVFTSGTTGKGKGVMLSQDAILRDMSEIIPYIDFQKKTVGVLPPHHTYGSTVMLVGHAFIGTEIYISSGIRYVQRELKEQKPGHLVLVPLYLETFYRKINANIKEQGKEKLVAGMMKLSNILLKLGIDIRKKLFAQIREAFGGEIEMIISGGAPINPEIMTFFESLGISMLNGYGITECAPLIAVNRSLNVVHGSVGEILDMDTVRIDEPNEDGEGEILVKGPNVMLGYYKDEKATAEAMTEDGFFRTGDYGKLDKNGILFITGRKKNLIILSNGKNVYPEEIENELVATPGIIDIIVYEGQSKRGIEHNAIVAEIYPDNDFFENNNIEDKEAYFKPFIDEFNEKTVPYKKISVLKVRTEEFPKNTLRKIMRFKIDTSIE